MSAMSKGKYRREGSIGSLILVRVMVFFITFPLPTYTHTQSHKFRVTHTLQSHKLTHQATHTTVYQFTCMAHGSQFLVRVNLYTKLLLTVM